MKFFNLILVAVKGAILLEILLAKLMLVRGTNYYTTEDCTSAFCGPMQPVALELNQRQQRQGRA